MDDPVIQSGSQGGFGMMGLPTPGVTEPIKMQPGAKAAQAGAIDSVTSAIGRAGTTGGVPPPQPKNLNSSLFYGASVVDALDTNFTNTGTSRTTVTAAVGTSTPTGVVSADGTTTSGLSSQDAAPVSGGRGNPWFAPNPMVAFTVNLTNMVRTEAQIQAMQNQLAVTTMKLNMELAQNMSATDLALGKANAQEKVYEAVASIIQAAASTASMGTSFAMRYGIGPHVATSQTTDELGERPPETVSENAELDTGATGRSISNKAELDANAAKRQQWDAKYKENVNNFWSQHYQYGASLGFDAAGKAGAGAMSFLEADVQTQIGQLNSAKDMLQAYQTANQKIMEGAFDGKKSASDNIDKILQLLQKLVDENFKAFRINPHGG